jgi:hypothetical protein
MQGRPAAPKGPNPWSAEVPGPPPEPQDPAQEPDDEPVALRPPDESGLIPALQQLDKRRRRSRDLTIATMFCVIGVIGGLAIGDAQNSTVASTSAAPSPTGTVNREGLITGATKAAVQPTAVPTESGLVTITVTGHAPGGLFIHYGTDVSTTETTKLPFTTTLPLDSSGAVLVYEVAAQLQGSGSISCSVAVNGTVLNTGTAANGYNYCLAQIGQNPVTRKWAGE